MSSPLQVDDVDALHALSSRLGEVAARIENPRLAAPPQLGELATGRAVADATGWCRVPVDDWVRTFGR
ncbi:hypothetical protein GS493_12205 [Rhodococcus hoagii]|nr:hypothetical protein [Prescottella equi]